MNILSYYGFDRPPFLEIGALDSADKISMYFADRRKELSVLEGLNAWGGSFAAVLTGQDGVGKTTLLRLLAGLERPARGEIRLGDHALSGETADAWRAGLGWMPQGPRFLGRSLRHNIGFGDDLDAELLQETHVAPIIRTLPAGALTPLGDTGAGLSGGEARRVMLARALHRQPGIVLSDEPTADLDAETARHIADALLDYVQAGGTLIVATHDPRLIERMQRHVALEAQP